MTAARDPLLHLVDRARRKCLLDAEADQLAAGIIALQGARRTPSATQAATDGRVSVPGGANGARDVQAPAEASQGRTELRSRLDTAIRPNMLLGLQDAELDGPGGTQRINEWADWIVDTVLQVLEP